MIMRWSAASRADSRLTWTTVMGVLTPLLSYIAVMPNFLASTPVLLDFGVHVDVELDASAEA